MAPQFKSLLNSAPELRQLLSKVQTLTALQQHVIAVMPPYLASTCQVLGLYLGTLSIAVANATVAAKLRQLSPELVIMLQNRGCEVSVIRVKVQVAYPAEPPKTTPRRLGFAAQNALQELSHNLGDSPLKLALEKMARLKD